VQFDYTKAPSANGQNVNNFSFNYIAELIHIPLYQQMIVFGNIITIDSELKIDGELVLI
jgi:hypothetical protein